MARRTFLHDSALSAGALAAGAPSASATARPLRVHVLGTEDTAFMRRLARVRAVKVGVCTGVMALSAAGFTRGRPATTHAIAKAALAAQGATVIDARVVDDGDLRAPRHRLAELTGG